MGMLDKAKDIAGKTGEKIAGGVGKATDAIDDKTGGKYSDHLQKVDNVVGKVANKGEQAATDAADAATDAASDAADAASDAVDDAKHDTSS